MTYKPTRYLDADLVLKPDIAPNNLANKYVRYAQLALNDLGYTPALTDDGQFGKKTLAAVKAFQRACKLVVSCVMDQVFWDAVDWRVYGDINGAWTHFRTKTSNVKPGGPAIVSSGGYAYNELTGLPVNSIGQCREGQRLSDVGEAFLKRSLGYEGAVRRNQVGTSGTPSAHWMGIAGDDMADQNADRIYEPEELLLMKTLRDYYILRTKGFLAVAATITYEDPYNNGKPKTIAASWRGRDRLRTFVLGNVQLPDKTWMFPDLVRRHDCSWTAVRATWKGLSGTAHVQPLHCHTDCTPGAPYGSPF